MYLSVVGCHDLSGSAMIAELAEIDALPDAHSPEFLNDHLAASAFGRKVEGCLFVLAKIVKYFEKNYIKTEK